MHFASEREISTWIVFFHDSWPRPVFTIPIHETHSKYTNSTDTYTSTAVDIFFTSHVTGFLVHGQRGGRISQIANHLRLVYSRRKQRWHRVTSARAIVYRLCAGINRVFSDAASWKQVSASETHCLIHPRYYLFHPVSGYRPVHLLKGRVERKRWCRGWGWPASFSARIQGAPTRATGGGCFRGVKELAWMRSDLFCLIF